MRRHVVVSVVLATACLGAVGAAASAVTARSASSSPRPHVTGLPAGVVVASAVGGVQPWQSPLRLTGDHGAVVAAQVTAPDGSVVSGVTAEGAWTSTARLVPSTVYGVSVTLHAPWQAGVTVQHTEVRTSAATRLLHAVLSPGDGKVVGVGEPIIVTFNRDVPAASQRAVARRLVVTTSPQQPGGWFWLSPTELHWRPDRLWQAHTRVGAALDLTGLYLGDGVWGVPGGHSIRYRIGDAHVSLVNAVTHHMSVTDNGRVVRVLPVSTGRDRYPTHAGVHITLEKLPVVTMDSATVGIPRSSPDGYYEQVYWDVRIADSGEFVHAAPWSVASQGSSNVSHGCVNLSTAEAEWFYGFSLLGDVVKVVGTPSAPISWDPGTADWNRSAASLSH